ncbi:hypothetical protein SARC_09734, partial [Sphaeroforma arctica JP610]
MVCIVDMATTKTPQQLAEYVLSQAKSHRPRTDADRHIEEVQSLWAGYGSVLRYPHCAINSGRVDEKTQEYIGASKIVVSAICKLVAPPKEDHTVGHTRKTRSYDNEMIFYESVRPLLKTSDNRQRCHIPEAYYLSKRGTARIFVLEDMKGAYPRY